MTSTALQDLLVRMATDPAFAEAVRSNPEDLVRRYGLSPADAATITATRIDTTRARPGRLEERLSRSGGIFGSALAGAVESLQAPMDAGDSGGDEGGDSGDSSGDSGGGVQPDGHDSADGHDADDRGSDAVDRTEAGSDQDGSGADGTADAAPDDPDQVDAPPAEPTGTDVDGPDHQGGDLDQAGSTTSTPAAEPDQAPPATGDRPTPAAAGQATDAAPQGTDAPVAVPDVDSPQPDRAPDSAAPAALADMVGSMAGPGQGSTDGPAHVRTDVDPEGNRVVTLTQGAISATFEVTHGPDGQPHVTFGLGDGPRYPLTDPHQQVLAIAAGTNIDLAAVNAAFGGDAPAGQPPHPDAGPAPAGTAGAPGGPAPTTGDQPVPVAEPVPASDRPDIGREDIERAIASVLAARGDSGGVDPALSGGLVDAVFALLHPAEQQAPATGDHGPGAVGEPPADDATQVGFPAGTRLTTIPPGGLPLEPQATTSYAAIELPDGTRVVPSDPADPNGPNATYIALPDGTWKAVGPPGTQLTWIEPRAGETSYHFQTGSGEVIVPVPTGPAPDVATVRILDLPGNTRLVTLTQGTEVTTFEVALGQGPNPQYSLVLPDGTRQAIDPSAELSGYLLGTQSSTALGDPVGRSFSVDTAADGSRVLTIGTGETAETYHIVGDRTFRVGADGREVPVQFWADELGRVQGTSTQGAALAATLSGAPGTPFTLTGSPDGSRVLVVGEGPAAQTYDVERTLDGGSAVFHRTLDGGRELVATAPDSGPEARVFHLVPDVPSPTAPAPAPAGPVVSETGQQYTTVRNADGTSDIAIYWPGDGQTVRVHVVPQPDGTVAVSEGAGPARIVDPDTLFTDLTPEQRAAVLPSGPGPGEEAAGPGAPAADAGAPAAPVVDPPTDGPTGPPDGRVVEGSNQGDGHALVTVRNEDGSVAFRYATGSLLLAQTFDGAEVNADGTVTMRFHTTPDNFSATTIVTARTTVDHTGDGSTVETTTFTEESAFSSGQSTFTRTVHPDGSAVEVDSYVDARGDDHTRTVTVRDAGGVVTAMHSPSSDLHFSGVQTTGDGTSYLVYTRPDGSSVTVAMTESAAADGSRTTVFSDGQRFENRALADGSHEMRQYNGRADPVEFSAVAADGTVYGRSTTLHNIAGSSTYAEFEHDRITHIVQYTSAGADRYDIEYVGDTMRIVHHFPGHSQTVTEIPRPHQDWLTTIDGARYIMQWADPSKQEGWGIPPEATHTEGPPQVSTGGADALRASGLGSLRDLR